MCCMCVCVVCGGGGGGKWARGCLLIAQACTELFGCIDVGEGCYVMDAGDGLRQQGTRLARCIDWHRQTIMDHFPTNWGRPVRPYSPRNSQ